jgi:Holliday junction resolvasome RuvABC ATP-dependent DNA helicase subunit
VALDRNTEIVDDDIFEHAMNLRGIDEQGLSRVDRKYLKALTENRGRPLGLKTLVSLTELSEDTIVNHVEPFLQQVGMIRKTSSGRMLQRVTQ